MLSCLLLLANHENYFASSKSLRFKCIVWKIAVRGSILSRYTEVNYILATSQIGFRQEFSKSTRLMLRKKNNLCKVPDLLFLTFLIFLSRSVHRLELFNLDYEIICLFQTVFEEVQVC